MLLSCTIVLSPLKRRNNTASIQAIEQCASPAVYASPLQKSLSSKGSVNLTASCRPASMSFGARANSMLEAFLLVSVNQGRQHYQLLSVISIFAGVGQSWSNFCVENCPETQFSHFEGRIQQFQLVSDCCIFWRL